MTTITAAKATEVTRMRFEEPRKGEILRPLTAKEVARRSERLATLINERNRVIEDGKNYAAGVTATKKELDEEIETLSLEVEFKEAWVPAQSQFDGIFDQPSGKDAAAGR